MLLFYGTVNNMKLAKEVRQFYLDNFDKLPFDKQFHFVSRLATWSGDSDCLTHLTNFKNVLAPLNQSIKDDLVAIMFNLPDIPINAAEERAPYFVKYGELRGLMLALFRVRHLLSIYEIDARQDLLSIKSYSELHELSQTLSKDEEALRILSTYAINYLYLVEHILYNFNTDVISAEKLYALGDTYNLANKHEVMLLIYLYTHCIIGESNFYDQPVSPIRNSSYQKMIKRLELVISNNFTDINLDNKLEFLVCCRITNFETDLFDRVYEECSESVSPEGTFLIDKLNTAEQKNKTSFAASEHRNVLFIMSTLEWKHANNL